MTPPSTTPLLDLRDLHVAYPIRGGVLGIVRDHLRAVDGVSLSIAPGETLGLVGESGCGKTTLARAVLRLETPQAGDILLDGHSLLGDVSVERRRDVQMIFQDPFSSLNPRMTVLDLVTEAAVVHGRVPKSERADRCRALLADVGMPPDILHRYPHAFSGGQRQRLSIARALSLEPRLLVCDEPVSALDVSVQAQVINLLMDLQRARGLTLLFISHDLSVVQHLARRVAVMYLGRIVEMGTTADVIDTPAHPYTRVLLNSVPRIGRPFVAPATAAPTGRTVAAGCPFHPRCPLADAACRATRPELEPVGSSPTHWVACCKQRSGSPSSQFVASEQ